MSRIWGIIREFFFSKANKELFLFIFFLVLSGIFWLITTLNETYEKEFTIPVSSRSPSAIKALHSSRISLAMC